MSEKREWTLRQVGPLGVSPAQWAVDGPCPVGPVVVVPKSTREAAEEELEHLARIADAAWQARTVLHLNLDALIAGCRGNPVALRNITDMLNDLSAVMPLSEDGKDWKPAALSPREDA